MIKIVLLLFAIFLAGCGAEPITQDFKLEAAEGFVKRDHDFENPHTYVIDQVNNEVYVDIHQPGFTQEDLEALENMTDEERTDFFESQPVFVEPIYDITLLEADKEKIVLEYEGERVEFTALSDSYFKTEDGIQYIIEYGTSIHTYLNQNAGN